MGPSKADPIGIAGRKADYPIRALRGRAEAGADQNLEEGNAEDQRRHRHQPKRRGDPENRRKGLTVRNPVPADFVAGGLCPVV